MSGISKAVRLERAELVNSEFARAVRECITPPTPTLKPALPDLAKVCADVKDQFQRDLERAVRKHDLYEAVYCLGQKEAVDLIQQRLCSYYTVT